MLLLYDNAFVVIKLSPDRSKTKMIKMIFDLEDIR